MTHRIAITGAGGAAAIALLRALADDPFDVFAVDADPAAAGLYLVPPDRRAVAPLARDADFGSWITQWCIEQRIDLLVPTVEDEFAPIAAMVPALEAAGVRVLMENELTIAVCTDKWALSAFVGDDVPQARTQVLNEDFEPDRWDFPLMVKPRRASGSRGIARIEHARDLAAVPHDGSMLVQQLLPGTEYSVDVLCDGPGNVVAAVPRERIKIDSGIAVASRTLYDQELIEIAGAAARSVGIRHMANVQLRRDEHGRPRLLEINARIPGTVALTIAAGINMPRHIVRRALGLETDAIEPTFAEVAMVRLLQDIVIDPSELAALTTSRADVAVPA